MVSFGDRLVEARTKQGLSQKRMAELLEITPTRLNYWEKNKREPDVEMIKKISALLKTDPNYLLGVDDNFRMRELLTPKEKTLINSYRSLSDTGKLFVESAINLELERQKQQVETDTLKSLSMKELLEANRLEDAPRYGVAAAATGNNEKFLVSRENEIEAKKILDDIHNQKLD